MIFQYTICYLLDFSKHIENISSPERAPSGLGYLGIVGQDNLPAFVDIPEAYFSISYSAAPDEWTK